MIESHINDVFRAMMLLQTLDAPHWARYASVSKQGFVYVWNQKPTVPTNYWCSGGAYKKVGELTLGYIKWKETLIEL